MNLPVRFIGLALALLALAGCDVDPAERVSAGNDLFSRADYLGALAAYQAAQVAAPDLPEPYYNAASAFARSGQLERAAAALDQALSLADDPLAAKAYYNLGNVYFEMSSFPEAVLAYQQALLRNPDDRDARYNLELALSRISVTPPPGSTDEMDDEDSPPPLPTDAPQAEPPSTTPAPPPPVGTLTVEQAENLLDAIQRSQQTLRDQLQRLTPQAEPPEKDW